MTKSHFRPSVSVSEINAFIECPSAWALTYHYGYKGKYTSNMQRGTDFEAEVNMRLCGDAFDDIQYDLTDKERLAVKPIVAILNDLNRGCLWQSFVKENDQEISMQHQLVDGNRIGYVDYNIKNKHIIDLKTSEKSPSEKLNAAHIRQLAFYRSFFDKSLYPVISLTMIFVIFLKTKNKIMVYSDDDTVLERATSPEFGAEIGYGINMFDLDLAEREINWAIKAIDRIKADTSLLDLIPLNTGNFRMNGYDLELKKKYLDGTLEINRR